MDWLSSYRKISEYSKRVNNPGTFDKILWSEDSVGLHVCIKASFCNFWDGNFEDLLIEKSSHDTCGAYHLLSNDITNLKRMKVQAERIDV